MRRISTAFALAVLLTLGAVAVAGEFLSRPAKRSIGAPPPELPAVSVRIPVTPNGFVAEWFAQGNVGTGAVLLLHGVRSDRTQMLGRALALQSAGYSVLLIDLPAHGESTGDRITFGVREGAGVEAALAYLRRELPTDCVGVIGVSLGAASLVLSHPSRAPDAVVLESMYPTISEAVQDRLEMRLGAWGARLAPLLLWQLPLRVGVPEEQLRPVEQLPKLRAPILIASGTNDLHTTWPETERIFAAAATPRNSGQSLVPRMWTSMRSRRPHIKPRSSGSCSGTCEAGGSPSVEAASTLASDSARCRDRVDTASSVLQAADVRAAIRRLPAAKTVAGPLRRIGRSAYGVVVGPLCPETGRSRRANFCRCTSEVGRYRVSPGVAAS